MGNDIVEGKQFLDVVIERMIAQRAYECWEERGRPIGSSQVDWYRAVQDVKTQFANCAGTSEVVRGSGASAGISNSL